MDADCPPLVRRMSSLPAPAHDGRDRGPGGHGQEPPYSPNDSPVGGRHVLRSRSPHGAGRAPPWRVQPLPTRRPFTVFSGRAASSDTRRADSRAGDRLAASEPDAGGPRRAEDLPGATRRDHRGRRETRSPSSRVTSQRRTAEARPAAALPARLPPPRVAMQRRTVEARPVAAPPAPRAGAAPATILRDGGAGSLPPLPPLPRLQVLPLATSSRPRSP